VRADVSEELELLTANVVPSSQMLSTMMMEAMNFSEKSVLTRATQRHIPDDGILHSDYRESLKPHESSACDMRSLWIA
jgi:hypothetical protein